MVATSGVAAMCGRYALYGPIGRACKQFDIDLGYDDFEIIPRDAPDPFNWADRYNIAPTQVVPVIQAVDNHHTFVAARWGLLPSWVKEPGKVTQPINAKLETAAERPMFRHAFRRSRVLLPASGFYEWRPGPDHKQPYFVRPVGGNALLGFGGLLERWSGPDGEVATVAILTTAANDLMAPIHDRMPVIIRPADYAAWLDPAVTDPGLVQGLASDYPAELLEAYPVGRAVGNPRAQGPALIERIED